MILIHRLLLLLLLLLLLRLGLLLLLSELIEHDVVVLHRLLIVEGYAGRVLRNFCHIRRVTSTSSALMMVPAASVVVPSLVEPLVASSLLRATAGVIEVTSVVVMVGSVSHSLDLTLFVALTQHIIILRSFPLE